MKLRKFFQKIIDFVFIGFRFLLPNEVVDKLGLTSLQQERFNICLEYARGKVLDIGCGEGNKFIKRWGNGVGVDVFPWREIDLLCDTKKLPFKDETFDTVTFIASLHHIVKTERKLVFAEANRVLRKKGLVLITTLNPLIGFVRHLLYRYADRDQKIRHMHRGETFGNSFREVKKLLKETNFKFIKRKRFVYGLNNLYIAKKGR